VCAWRSRRLQLLVECEWVCERQNATLAPRLKDEEDTATDGRERTDTMRLRMLLALGIGVLLGVLGTAGVSVWAQQNLPKTPSVLTPQGSLVEEVRVGDSCVVIVSTTGSAPRQIAATPCR